MATFKDYILNQKQVSFIVVDSNGGEFLWIAYAKSGTTCLLQKVSAYDLTQVYFSVSLAVDAVIDMRVLENKLYIIVEHSSYAIYVITVTNPLSSQTAFTKTELDITETPIALTTSATNVYALTAGVSSGENSKIVSFDSVGDYVETIDLMQSAITVDNAVSLTADSNDNIWIVTDDDPALLYRVYLQSGAWIIEETTLE
jgi:hypothetical protein